MVVAPCLPEAGANVSRYIMYYSLASRLLLNGKSVAKPERRTVYQWIGEATNKRNRFATKEQAQAVADTAPESVKHLLCVCETIDL
jgi:hypothetical protein